MSHIDFISMFIYNEYIPFTEMPTNYDELVKLIMDFVKRIREDPKVKSKLHKPIGSNDPLIIRLYFSFFNKAVTLSAYAPSFEMLLRAYSETFAYEFIVTHELSVLPNIQNKKYIRWVEVFCKLSKLLDKLNLPIRLISEICFIYTHHYLQDISPHNNDAETERVLYFLEQLIKDGLLEELHWRGQCYAKIAETKSRLI